MKFPSLTALVFAFALAVMVGIITFFSASSKSADGLLRDSPETDQRYLQTKTKCACDTCTMDVWQTLAIGSDGQYTCGDRIKELKKSTYAMTACRMVGSNYPTECGACNPDTCANIGAVDSESTYVEATSTTTEASTTTTISLPTVTYMGNNGQGGVFPLDRCQGDCDSDAECMPGLICFQRDGNEAVPGCSGTDDLGYDYCIEPPSSSSVPAPDYWEEKEDAPVDQVSSYYDPQAGGSGSSSSDGGNNVDDFYSNDDIPDYNDDTGNGEYTVSDPFALKMYWQPGYTWQEENFERKWCMRCDSSRQECAAGRGVYITNCDEDMITNWEFLNIADGSFFLRLTEADLCLQANGRARVTVEQCDLSNTAQNWMAVNGVAEWNNRFELRAKPFPDDCATQQHHPRQGEFLFLYPCVLPESDTTNFWNLY